VHSDRTITTFLVGHFGHAWSPPGEGLFGNTSNHSAKTQQVLASLWPRCRSRSPEAMKGPFEKQAETSASLDALIADLTARRSQL